MGKTIAWLMILSLFLMACNNDEQKKQKKDGTTEKLDEFFKQVALPYSLSDTSLLKNMDGELLPASVSSFIPANIIESYFGKKASVKFTSLAKPGKENYYLIKAASSSKKAAFILLINKEDNSGTAYPFLLPDADASTTQSSSIDKKYTITKSIVRRSRGEIIAEGKEVVAWDASTKNFSVIMTDALNNNPDEIINPIDTFSKTHKLSGDYYLNKKNLVSVRDGRYSNQLLVYIHTQNEAGDCRGELKGEFLMTSANFAIYRLGGDPCVLNLSFSGNKVSIKEERGCGNHRDLDCPLTGTFTRKKPAVVKQASKKEKRK